ncbi:glyoxalase/bleomycin resistance/dioxygenase family protein [Micromonospora globispora]|uniref:Glyoxalase/bleomycin resistance/dioxygenase family protein n=1 Tax=Micromonospora globispora TaxID=1450148 RepID=A0A317K0G8_9ACTN|nr:VOC family protein [Micromonospora globispora]PWU44693.1 glyoxalase/bleomycin resistance/dioxygenase family protein [Micromonospora globispora]RQW87236.1 glyoxalase/bleomycin resistance/dioxygenase family protein [Micromonospora globispora]
MHRSRVHALILDVPQESAPAAAAFWSAALGAPARPDAAESEFTNLPDVVPDLVTAIQAVDDAPRYHLDIETDDVRAEVDRLVGLGATPVSRWQECHVLRAPSAHLPCVIPVACDPELFAATARRWD